jgi:hypothetical protein
VHEGPVAAGHRAPGGQHQRARVVHDEGRVDHALQGSGRLVGPTSELGRQPGEIVQPEPYRRGQLVGAFADHLAGPLGRLPEAGQIAGEPRRHARCDVGPGGQLDAVWFEPGRRGQ